MKSNRTALLPEQRAAIRRALLLDMLTACCVLSSVALPPPIVLSVEQ